MPPVEHFDFNYIMRAFGPASKVSVQDTVAIALRAVAAASRHDVFCGGGCQFLVLRGMSASGVFGHDYDSSGDHIRDYDRWCGALLSAMARVELPDAEFQERLDRLAKHVTEISSAILKPGSPYRGLVSICDSLQPVRLPTMPDP
jgi:hypothetical protein